MRPDADKEASKKIALPNAPSAEICCEAVSTLAEGFLPVEEAKIGPALRSKRQKPAVSVITTHRTGLKK
jgi:hypothetical protein